MKPRILLCEPDPELRDELGACLARAGYAVLARSALDAELLAAERGADAAVAATRASQPDPRLDALCAALAPAPVLATSSELTPERALELRRRGAAAALRTPFAASALLDLLAGLLRARAGLAQAPASRSPRVQSLLRHADALARGNAPVLLLGEHGSGRRWLARRIHARGPRCGAPLVCADGSEWLDASDAAPARAADARLARAWDAARGGSLLLSGLSELSPALQRELLERLLEPRSKDSPRLVATARGSLRGAAAGLLPDLWLRLSGAALELPPLRERLEDLPDLARHFLARTAAERGALPPELGSEALAALAEHPFRGNLAELENLMRRAVITGCGARIEVSALLDPRLRRAAPPARDSLDLRALEREAIERALAAAAGNRTHASRALGISVRTLRNKLQRYRLAARD